MRAANWRDVLLWIRPYQTVYQLAVFGLVLASKEVKAVGLAEVAGLLAVLVSLPALFIVNDYIHSPNDRLMGRQRFFSRFNRLMRSPLIIAACLVGACSILAERSGLPMLITYLLLVGSVCLYAIAKRYRSIVSLYGFRAVSGALLYLVIAAPLGLNQRDYITALLVGLFDLQTNIAGDVRDVYADCKTRLKTLPLVWGVRRTTIVLLLLQILCLAGFRLTFFSLSGTWIIAALLGAVPAWISYLYVLSRGEELVMWAHACHHGYKLYVLCLIGRMLAGQSLDTSIYITAVVLVIWFVAYSLYLFGDHRGIMRALTAQGD